MTLSERMQAWLAGLSRRGDLVIVTLLLAAVLMMLIPLPTFLIDILITINISISVLILLTAFYVPTPLAFSSLPSVLLIATLFRLAITISTTRLILLQADAGEIITAFGSFVVGGSVAVGLVVFLIITVAQFIVVARGAERVAEVAARFTLDALPGKQMSIDADLRNGVIDQPTARQLRRDLERESQLFGAMDGAMKFVKGDVIAGIVIILVNLIGGFTVGIVQHGMSFARAASTYSLLTVGDGLVAQIPALLVAVAAGTMVTRVGSAEGTGDLGRQITGQLLADARALGLAAIIMVGLAVVPGFPAVVFLGLGAAFGAGAYATYRRNAGKEAAMATQSAEQPEETAPALQLAQIFKAEQPSSFRVHVRLGPQLASQLPDGDCRRLIEEVRREIFGDLGVEVPAIALQTDKALPGRSLRVDIEGAPVFQAEIPSGRLLVEAEEAHLDLLDLSYERVAANAGRRRAYWVDERRVDALRQAEVSWSSASDVMAAWVAAALRRHCGHFIGIQETQRLLSGMEEDYADLVRQAQDVVPLHRSADILRRLVSENVPIHNLRLILEALVEWGQREQDGAQLTERVRFALRRQISFRAADRNNIIAAFVLQRSGEDILRASLQAASGSAFDARSQSQAQALVAEIEKAMLQTGAGIAPIALTAADIRQPLRSLLADNAIDLSVLSFAELVPEFHVQPLVMIEGRAERRGAGASITAPQREADRVAAG